MGYNAKIAAYNTAIEEWKKVSLKFQLTKNAIAKRALAVRVNAAADKVADLREKLPAGVQFRDGSKLERPHEVDADKNL